MPNVKKYLNDNNVYNKAMKESFVIASSIHTAEKLTGKQATVSNSISNTSCALYLGLTWAFGQRV